MDNAVQSEKYLKAGINIAMYTILPMLAFMAWVIGMPLFLYGGVITSVEDAQGPFQTLFIFSLPMLLFFGIVPVLLQLKKKTSVIDLGLCFQYNWQSIVTLVINILFALTIFTKLVLVIESLSEAVPVIFQLCAIGVSEEILCRCVIYHEIEHAFHNKAATIFISAVIFAFLFHSGDGDLTNLLVRLPLGLIFAAVRCYTGNIYNSIVMHIWYNSLMFIL